MLTSLAIIITGILTRGGHVYGSSFVHRKSAQQLLGWEYRSDGRFWNSKILLRRLCLTYTFRLKAKPYLNPSSKTQERGRNPVELASIHWIEGFVCIAVTAHLQKYRSTGFCIQLKHDVEMIFHGFCMFMTLQCHLTGPPNEFGQWGNFD